MPRRKNLEIWERGKGVYPYSYFTFVKYVPVYLSIWLFICILYNSLYNKLVNVSNSFCEFCEPLTLINHA